jgi:hypothetical protein
MKLIKTTFLLLLSMATVSAVVAQSEDSYVRPNSSFTSNSILSAGFGMGGYYPYTGTSAIESPNITLNYQRALFKNAGPGTIDLGALASYKSIFSSYMTYYNDYSYTQHWKYYILGTRLSYHVNPFNNKKIELYAGGMVAYYITVFNFSSNDPNTSDPADPGYALTTANSPNFFALSIFGGIRSWISPHSGVWLELGYGYTTMAFGVSYKI